MARIVTYDKDEKVEKGDKWIGSDRSGKTVNFDSDLIAKYMNEAGSILQPGARVFKSHSTIVNGVFVSSSQKVENVVHFDFSKTSIEGENSVNWIEWINKKHILVQSLDDTETLGFFFVHEIVVNQISSRVSVTYKDGYGQFDDNIGYIFKGIAETYTKTEEPEIIDPSFHFHSDSPRLVKADHVYDQITLNVQIDRGQIVGDIDAQGDWDESLIQGTVAPEPSKIVFEDDFTVIRDSSDLSITLIDKVFALGYTNYKTEIHFNTDGIEPLDSLRKPINEPFYSQIVTMSKQIEAVYPIYATFRDIHQLEETDALVSNHENGAKTQFEVIGEKLGNTIAGNVYASFAYPTHRSNAISAISVWDEASDSFKKVPFTQWDSEVINLSGVNYTKWTSKGSPRGGRLIELTF